MPTAAKLAAAVFFGALAWYVSLLIIPLFPEGTDLGRFPLVNALIGGAIGWRVAGPKAPATWTAAVAYGLTAAVTMTFVALFLHSFVLMIRQSLRRVYEGPMEAFLGVIDIMTENLAFMATPRVVGTILVGGIIAGLATEWFGRRYR